MFFLDGLHSGSGRGMRGFRAMGGAIALIASVAALSGCGGGGDDGNPNPNPSASPTGTTATVRGRLIENSTGENISGVVVSFGSLQVTTGADGQFSFTVPGGTAATTLRLTIVDGPDANDRPDYYSVGYVSGQQIDVVTGIQIVPSQLEAGDNTNLGDIRLFSEDLPPPPPTNSL